MGEQQTSVPRRGRPAGRTELGESTRRRLFDTALELIARDGFDETTLRGIASAAGVSPALLYRYFPSKRALVMELHGRLTAEYVERIAASRERRWGDRLAAALRTSVEVLWPHRAVLVALTSELVSNRGDGVLAPKHATERRRVEGAFVAAVRDADDAPERPFAEAIGRLAYVAHLGVLLWWLLDRTDEQRATTKLLALIETTLASPAVPVVLPVMRGFLERADALVRWGLFREGDDE